MFRRERKRLRADRRGITPALSTVIMTAALVVLVLVVVTYGQNYLTTSIAQNEFSTNQQFMVTTGLQIDNVAWMVGRAQTIQYSSTYGYMETMPNVLTYTIQLYDGSNQVAQYALETGIIMYNVPTNEYSLGNNYFQPLSSSDKAFLQVGSAAPDSYVYSIEKLHMSDGNYLRIVIVPSIRMMTTQVGTQNYAELYLPLLESGTSLGLSQTVTLICKTVNQYVQSSVTKVTVTQSFPQASAGFNSGFFPFQSPTQTVTLSSGSTVQLYVGEVSVAVGMYG